MALPLCAQQSDAGESVPCLIKASKQIDVAVEVAGRVEEVSVEPGQTVDKGDLLVRQSAAPERAALALAERAAADTSTIEAAEARLDLLNAQESRMSQLIGKDLVAQNTYDSLLAEQVTAQEQLQRAREDHIRATLERDRVKAELAQRVIKAPISGLVTEVDIEAGELGDPQVPLLRLAVLDPLLIAAYLPIRLHGTLTPGRELTVKPEPPVGGTYQARIEVIDKVYDPASGTFGIRLYMDNPQNTLPAGIHCTLEVPG
ncbi:efflux RND transporter periplasmic adaptor subunit [Roseovarius sp. MMSF_3281]|uniref:efflux RND transporter periplasmic adaptor subunit n=1 Tax=Roseovarius sp. MMSF_3281 TaxID=3046694 RepID=UPI00273E7449|nr:efflux RND transporter periplasmic adaptor subunit [Roseovarius sp. MMSF_3281]